MKKIVAKGDLKSKVTFYQSRQVVPLNASSASKVLNTVLECLLQICSPLL